MPQAMCIKNALIAMGRKLNRQDAKDAKKKRGEKVPPRFLVSKLPGG
jgi:hypothetical protein